MCVSHDYCSVAMENSNSVDYVTEKLWQVCIMSFLYCCLLMMNVLFTMSQSPGPAERLFTDILWCKFKGNDIIFDANNNF